MILKIILKEISEIKSSRKDLRNFGLIVGGVLVLIGATLFWKGRPAFPYFLAVGAFLVTAGLSVPSILKPLQKLWMTIAVIMGFVMTRVILTALFFLVLTPLALIARVLGKHFLTLTPDKTKDSYWNKRETKKVDKKDYEKQF